MKSSRTARLPQPAVSEGAMQMKESKGMRSLPPPEMALQASPSQDGQTQGYQSHANDPRPFSSIPGMVEYGERLEGQVGVRGKGDEHEISSNDVNQGYIGNCYMMGALASLANQSPEIIRNAISGPKPDGTYDVTLYTGFGRDTTNTLTPQTVNVSTAFVTNAAYDMGGGEIWDEAGEVTYARDADVDGQGNEELWVRLIEKAWASVLGGFEEADGGWPQHVFEALTGKHYIEHHFNGAPDYEVGEDTRVEVMSDEELKNAIISGLASGSGMACSSAGHTWTIVAADQDSITLRDPQWKQWEEQIENKVWSWEEFRSTMVKFTSVI